MFNLIYVIRDLNIIRYEHYFHIEQCLMGLKNTAMHKDKGKHNEDVKIKETAIKTKKRHHNEERKIKEPIKNTEQQNNSQRQLRFMHKQYF